MNGAALFYALKYKNLKTKKKLSLRLCYYNDTHRSYTFSIFLVCLTPRDFSQNYINNPSCKRCNLYVSGRCEGLITESSLLLTTYTGKSPQVEHSAKWKRAALHYKRQRVDYLSVANPLLYSLHIIISTSVVLCLSVQPFQPSVTAELQSTSLCQSKSEEALLVFYRDIDSSLL